MITKLKDIQLGPVTVRGWLEKVTSLKKHSFATLRDGVGQESHLQVFIPKRSTALSGQMTKSVVEDLTIESYVEIEGEVRTLPSKAHSFRPFELEARKVTVLGTSHSDFTTRCPPEAGSEVKLEERHLYIRDSKFALITALRAILVKVMREHFEETGCIEIFPPSFVGNQCEGGATLFKLSYPDKDKGDVPAYLTQSSQFYLEYVLPGIGDCFCIVPSFRAERSQTRRHLTEFLHAEAEWSGILTLQDHLDKLTALIKGTVSKFLKYGRKYLDELKLTERVEKLLEMCDDIVVLTHRDAIEYCKEHKIYKDAETQTYFEYEDDIPEMQERQVIDSMDKIVFLVRFPKSFKSFYMQKSEDPKYVLGCDVECPGVGEVIGSGIRVYDLDELKSRLKEQGLKESEYREYIDIRKYGAGRTSGMGLGVDRFLTWLLGAYTIRDVVTFPRYPGRLFP
ncbi:Aminoacyl-tRNA synthetase [uncultured virus]|nr:Aminoacyl-tRNA synthetase [uncultured virus]